MANIIDSLIITLGLDAKKFHEGIKTVEENLKETAHKAQEAAEKIEAFGKHGEAAMDGLKEHVLGMLSVFASVGAFMAFTESTVKAQVATMRLSKEAHIGVEELGALQMVADKFGGSAEGVNSSIKMLGGNLGVLGTKLRGAKQAAMGLGMVFGKAGNEAEAFAVKTFKGKTAMEAMLMLADKVKGMEFLTAQKVLGRVGIRDEGMMRALAKGKEAFEEYIEEHKKFAATEEDVHASHEFEEAQKDAGFAIKKVGMMIVQFALPALKLLTDALFKIANWVREHPALIKAAFTAIGVVLAVLGYQMMLVAAKAAIMWLAITWPVALVVAAVALVVGALVYLYNKFEFIRNAVGAVGQAMKKAWNIFIIEIYAAWEVAKNFFAAIFDYWDLLWGIITLNGDKIKSAWARMCGHLGEAFKLLGAMIRLYVMTIYYDTVDAFNKIWPAIKDEAMKFFTWIADKFLGVAKVMNKLLPKKMQIEGLDKVTGADMVNVTGQVIGNMMPATGHAAEAVHPTSVMSANHKQNTSSTHIGELHVNAPAATDANGVAEKMHEAIQEKHTNLVNQADGGM